MYITAHRPQTWKNNANYLVYSNSAYPANTFIIESASDLELLLLLTSYLCPFDLTSDLISDLTTDLTSLP